MLGLFLTLNPAAAPAVQKKHPGDKRGVVNTMTVLRVGPPEKDVTYISILFRVSQRVYKLPKDANPAYLRLLRESERNHTPVLVRRTSEESDVIFSVGKPEKP